MDVLGATSENVFVVMMVLFQDVYTCKHCQQDFNKQASQKLISKLDEY